MKKGTFSNILLVIVLIAGLSLMLYPSFSNWWNSSRQTQVITRYAEAVASLDDEEYEPILESARKYNADLLTRFNSYLLEGDLEQRYWQELNFSGDGIMGYVEIPGINVMLPIFHGTEETVLQRAIGHLEWSSLPTGGESTHCVISGHRGLPSAKLFTDLDQMVIGDYFLIHVLNETLTYEVDQIRIVLPNETEDLLIQEGEDRCTLFTCTPYGINTHRLLVRGHRVDSLEMAEEVRVSADAVIIEKLVVAPFVLAPILLVMFIILLIPNPNQKKRR